MCGVLLNLFLGLNFFSLVHIHKKSTFLRVIVYIFVYSMCRTNSFLYFITALTLSSDLHVHTYSTQTHDFCSFYFSQVCVRNNTILNYLTKSTFIQQLLIRNVLTCVFLKVYATEVCVCVFVIILLKSKISRKMGFLLRHNSHTTFYISMCVFNLVRVYVYE